MIELIVPGWKHLKLERLFCDFNGTLATDGVLAEGVASRLRRVAERIPVEILTADTHGNVHEQLAGLPVTITVISKGNELQAKSEAVASIGGDRVVFFGNGANDKAAMRMAAFSVGVVGVEGAFVSTLQEADLVVFRSVDAFDLLLNESRIAAGLRR